MRENVREKRLAQILLVGDYLEIRCNIGHILEVHRLNEKGVGGASSFGGSILEADWVSGELQERGNRLAEACQGFGHKKGEKYEVSIK